MISDILTAIPPAALLVAMRYELREPNERVPFGYFRAVSIAFLVTAAVLSLIGVYLLADSVLKLVHQQRPPIGTMTLFGHQFWTGWAMIAALAYSMSVGILLGKLKQPVAKHLHDKMLQAESEMNRAEWMSEGAAILGIVLVGYGHWWGDAAAAAFVSIEIVRDGWDNVRQVVGDLMDEAPTQLGQRKLEDITAKVKDAAERLDWVASAAVRLREQGRVIGGDVMVVPRDTRDIVSRIDRARRDLLKVDWRLHSLTMVPAPRDARSDGRGMASR